jgi:hypothetical protein
MKLFWKNDNWEFYGACGDGQKFEIDGINVWNHDWVSLSEPKAKVKDPRYGQSFEFPVYKMEHEGKQVTFAAGEFSNCMWGFYVRA